MLFVFPPIAVFVSVRGRGGGEGNVPSVCFFDAVCFPHIPALAEGAAARVVPARPSQLSWWSSTLCTCAWAAACPRLTSWSARSSRYDSAFCGVPAHNRAPWLAAFCLVRPGWAIIYALRLWSVHAREIALGQTRTFRSLAHHGSQARCWRPLATRRRS